jgi:hypothetical protein
MLGDGSLVTSNGTASVDGKAESAFEKKKLTPDQLKEFRSKPKFVKYRRMAMQGVGDAEVWMKMAGDGMPREVISQYFGGQVPEGLADLEEAERQKKQVEQEGAERAREAQEAAEAGAVTDEDRADWRRKDRRRRSSVVQAQSNWQRAVATLLDLYSVDGAGSVEEHMLMMLCHADTGCQECGANALAQLTRDPCKKRSVFELQGVRLLVATGLVAEAVMLSMQAPGGARELAEEGHGEGREGQRNAAAAAAAAAGASDRTHAGWYAEASVLCAVVRVLAQLSTRKDNQVQICRLGLDLLLRCSRRTVSIGAHGAVSQPRAPGHGGEGAGEEVAVIKIDVVMVCRQAATAALRFLASHPGNRTQL